MAFLIEGSNLDDEISLDMFYPESFRSLDELIVIHEENLIVVKEIWSGKMCDTFFNLHTLERIDPFKRYNQENGKAFIETIDDLTVVTTVSIETGTMAEYLFGAVFRNEQQISNLENISVGDGAARIGTSHQYIPVTLQIFYF